MDTAMSVVHSVEPDLSSLSWFALLWLVCCVSGLTISGMLPLRETSPVRGGAVLVIGNVIALLLLVIGTLLFAALSLRVSSIILVSAAVFLYMPVAFNSVPQKWRDTRAGLALLMCIQITALTFVCRSDVITNKLLAA